MGDNPHWPWGTPSNPPVPEDDPLRQLWHSRDNGKHWDLIEVSKGSFLATLTIKPGEDYDDGLGNLYRDSLPPEE